jgi:hypothetical protein
MANQSIAARRIHRKREVCGMVHRARRVLALTTLVMAIAACNNGGSGAGSAAPVGPTAPAGQSAAPAASGGGY